MVLHNKIDIFISWQNLDVFLVGKPVYKTDNRKMDFSIRPQLYLSKADTFGANNFVRFRQVFTLDRKYL